MSGERPDHLGEDRLDEGHRAGDPAEPAAPHDDAGLRVRLDRLEHLLVKLGDDQGSAPVPAWRRRTNGEHRTAATVTILVAVALMVALPQRVANHPRWLLPMLALLLLVALTIANPGRLERESRLLRVGSLTLIAVLSLANALSAGRLVVDLARAQGIRDPSKLLLTGAAIWITNIVIFGLWYWESDRDGPVQRALGTKTHPDFLFPQMTSPEFSPDLWEPAFFDYLYLSFTNATAFSPTDVMPMSRWAKIVMMSQSTISIVTVALVIARAVNLLH